MWQKKSRELVPESDLKERARMTTQIGSYRAHKPCREGFSPDED
jgi:hypothetical protein